MLSRAARVSAVVERVCDCDIERRRVCVILDGRLGLVCEFMAVRICCSCRCCLEESVKLLKRGRDDNGK